MNEVEKYMRMAIEERARADKAESQLNVLETLISDLDDLDDGKYRVGNWADIQTINRVKAEVAARPPVNG